MMQLKHFIVLLATSLAFWPDPAVAQSFRVGQSAVNITPPSGMPFQVPQRPPFPVMIAVGTHDPLHAKAIVLESEGLTVKQNSPYRFTIVNTLANGAIGYVPNRKAYREGGYGASPGSTRCNPGSGEALVESAIRQLIAHREMKPAP